MTIPERYNVSSLLDRNLEAGRANRIAISCGDERVTYRELIRRVNRFASALDSHGFRRDERVVMVLNDSPAFPVAFFGAIRAGCVPVPANPLLKWEDQRYFLMDSYAQAVVVDHEHYEKVQRALDGHLGRVEVIVANGTIPGSTSLDEFLRSGRDDFAPADTHRDDMAFWLYSSGSTGNPKGVVHLHHDIPFCCEAYGRHVLKIRDTDVTFAASKLFHAYGLGANMYFPYWVGASTVLYPGRPAPQAIFEVIQRQRPTLFFSVPTFYNALLNVPDARRYDLSSIRLCVSAAEALPPEIWRRWKETFGHALCDGIGTTELLHIFISNTPEATQPGSSGRPVPGYDVRVVDDDGQPVAPGHAGHLHVRGDSAAPFYWHFHEKSKATMVGDWMRTGDWYRIGEDGFYYSEGRSDDMMKVGGLWVSPVAMENALMEHVAVLEAAVVGVPVQGLNKMKAFVILREDRQGSPALIEELQQWCKERLARYQYPQLIEFVPDLPKTVTGKIQRFKLRQMQPARSSP